MSTVDFNAIHMLLLLSSLGISAAIPKSKMIPDLCLLRI